MKRFTLRTPFSGAILALMAAALFIANASAQAPPATTLAPVETVEEAEGPAFRALLIAAEAYDAGLGRLSNSCAQMEGIRARLGYLGYKDVTMVSDHSRIKPTGRNIRAAVDALARRTKPEDTLLVIIAAHGISANGESYICPLDHASPRLNRRTFISSCVPVSDIYASLNRAGASNTLLVLEACRTRVGTQTTSEADFIRDVGKGLPPGMLVFTSCSDTEQSWTLPVREEDDKPARKLSVFLHFIDRGLQEADYRGGGNNGRLTASEFYNYIAKRTTEFTENAGYAQHPQVLGQVSSFVLGEYANTNSHLSMRIPIDEQFELTLDTLVESGNEAVRSVKSLLQTMPMESIYWMDNTGRFGKKSIQLQKSERWYNVLTSADAQIADHAFKSLYDMHQETLEQIRKRCFDTDIELRESSRTRVYRGNLFRLMGDYNAAKFDYDKAGVEFGIFVPFSAKIYPQKPKSLGGGNVSRVPGLTTVEEEAKGNTIDEMLQMIRERDGNAETETEAEGEESDELNVVRATVLDTAPYAPHMQATVYQGQKPIWVKVIINDLGQPFVGWVQVEDVFWSPDLAEIYWSTPDAFEHMAQNYKQLAEAKVQRIHNAVHFYHNVASILAFAGVGGLPNIGGYVAMAESIIRQTVQTNIARRKGEVTRNVTGYYLNNWWLPHLEQEVSRYSKVEAGSSMFDMGEEVDE